MLVALSSLPSSSFPTHRHGSEFLFYALDRVLARFFLDFLWWFTGTFITSFMATSTAGLFMFDKRNATRVTFPAETESDGFAHALTERKLFFHITRVAIGPFIGFWSDRR